MILPAEARAAMLQFLVAARRRRLEWTYALAERHPISGSRLSHLCGKGVLYGEKRPGATYALRWYADPKEVAAYCDLSLTQKRRLTSGKTTIRELMDLPDLSDWEERGRDDGRNPDGRLYYCRGRLVERSA